jgi:hypothetical protein
MLKKGDTTRALQLYQKSFDLDHNNTNAQKVIKDILDKKKS